MDFRVKDGVNTLCLQSINRNPDRITVYKVGIRHNHDPPRTGLPHIESNFTGRAEAIFDGGSLHYDGRFMIHISSCRVSAKGWELIY
jgi:hypothetical protein